jgi:hypothetical protein
MFYTMWERMNLTTDSNPSLVFKLVKTTGFSPRIFLASRSITPKSAPTKEARSILLITNKSDLVIPGPPLRGILSPQRHRLRKLLNLLTPG